MSSATITDNDSAIAARIVSYIALEDALENAGNRIFSREQMENGIAPYIDTNFWNNVDSDFSFVIVETYGGNLAQKFPFSIIKEVLDIIPYPTSVSSRNDFIVEYGQRALSSFNHDYSMKRGTLVKQYGQENIDYVRKLSNRGE